MAIDANRFCEILCCADHLSHLSLRVDRLISASTTEMIQNRITIVLSASLFSQNDDAVGP